MMENHLLSESDGASGGEKSKNLVAELVSGPWGQSFSVEKVILKIEAILCLSRSETYLENI